MITKKLLTTALWIGLFTAYPTTVNGQFWKKIKKRIESKAEDKVLEKVDDLNFDNTDKLPNKEGDFVKTGNTKNILGYLCSEYLYKHERGSARVWVTKKFPIKSNYAPLLGMTKNSKIKGFVLELDYESNSGEKAMVKVTKIEKDKNVKINSANYKSMF